MGDPPQKEIRKVRSLFTLVTHVRELWPLYLGIIICSVLMSATTLASPFILQRVVDQIAAAPGVDAWRPLVLAAALLFAAELANTVIGNIGGYFGDTMAARLRAILSERYFAKLLALPQRYFDNELSGTIIGRLSRSITETTNFLQSLSNNFLPMLITVVAVLVVTASYSPVLALLILIIFPLYTWLTALTSTRWQRIERAKNAEIDQANGRFAEAIGQIRVVKSFVQERHELDSFDTRYASTVGLTKQQSRFWHGMDIARRGILNLIFFAIYVVIFMNTLRGVFSIGTLVLLVQMISMVRQPITMMSYLVDTAQRAITGSRDYLAVMNTPTEVDPASFAAPARLELPAPVADAPMVRFSDVDFAYDPANPVLTDIDLAIAQGERVALVSESGGGKSTLVALLLGLYSPTAGRIEVAGHEIGELGLPALRRQIATVFQEPALFSGTIAENIAYACPDADQATITAAAERANADAFIRTFPDGYDTVVGERGLKLSGGQKQRIAVARAMVADAPILVLDEATSALDSRAERHVQAGLEELMKGRTSIIIAHRLSTIASVDRIITLRDGRIDEVGSPEELATTDGIYAELLELQASTSRRDRRRLRDFGISG